jgi:hypothetical protein
MEEEEVQRRGEEKDTGLICLFRLATSSSDFPFTECRAAEGARSSWKETAIAGWGMRKRSKTRAVEGSLRPGPALRVWVPSENMNGLGKNCLDLNLRCSPFWLEQSESSLDTNRSEHIRKAPGGLVGDTRAVCLACQPKEPKTAPGGTAVSHGPDNVYFRAIPGT